MSSSVERLCSNPSCMQVGKHLCTGCGEELYCSKDCQKAHWPTHKVACKTATKPEAAAFMKSFDALSVKQLKNVMKAKAAQFDKKKRDAVLEKLETVVEKAALVKLVKEHVKPAEVEALLSSSPAATTPTSSSAAKKRAPPAQKYDFKTPTPTPAQMREQAAWIRKNPQMLRQSQAAFANLTDAQIMQYADQLEQTANDPNMLKEVERMASMSPEDRSIFQTIQEGVAGVKPIDQKWINTVVKAFKKKPETFKNLLQGRGAMLGGVTDEQVFGFIDMMARQELWVLQWIAYAIWCLGSLVRPAAAAYKVVDDYTFGSARYLVMILVMIVLYYVSFVSFIVLKAVWKYVYALVVLVYRMVYPALGNTTSAAGGLGAGGAAGEGAAAGSNSNEFEF